MKRTSQRSTDFIISFSNNSLHKFCFPFSFFLNCKSKDMELKLDWFGQLTLTGNQPIQSVGLLTRITCWVELICLFFLFFFCSWLFFCVWAISYKNTKGIWRRPREISFVKNNHLLLVMEGDNRQKKISQKEKLQHRKRRKTIKIK
jgi:hypothetical protein